MEDQLAEYTKKLADASHKMHLMIDANRGGRAQKAMKEVIDDINHRFKGTEREGIGTDIAKNNF